MSNYVANQSRYEKMLYNRCGRSGLRLPAVSLGLWHNWGDSDVFANGRLMVRRTFDLGITHFDLANNYGPPYGSAEENFGRILTKDFKTYRDELIISTKAGWDMWPGPYGNFGSRKYLIASLDQSLKRMGLDYVDIFYHHRPDPETPLEETMTALDHIVRSGRALYVGVSQYRPELMQKAIQILRDLGTPCLIHQPNYNMFDRWIEEDLLDLLENEGVGCIVFSPLAQGLLSDKYLKGIPADSRAGSESIYFHPEDVTPEKLDKIRSLNMLAADRGQSLAQMAISWVLRKKAVTSALIGASRVQQIEQITACLDSAGLSDTELGKIEEILAN